MELLLLLAPTIRKVYFVYDSTAQPDTSSLDKLRAKASQLGISLLEKPVAPQQASSDIISQFKASEAQAILMEGGNLFNNKQALDNLKSVVMREQLLMIGSERFTLDEGAIFSYGSPYSSLGYQSAPYVDKVLHGSNPAVMPVSQPDKLELILNKKLADQFNRKIPAKLFDGADEII
jgi:putative ABC transport system substrate-binding protein